MAVNEGLGQAPVPDDAIGGDTMLWYARAIWRSRLFFCTSVLAGVVWGVVSAMLFPRFQTVCLFTELNPVISHRHRDYWETIGRATTVQLKMLAEGEGPEWMISVRPETDPWMQRIEIRHDEKGEGLRLAERLHARLREQNEANLRNSGLTVSGGLLSERERLSESLNKLQKTLAAARLALELPLPALDQTEIPPPESLTILPKDVEKLPFEALPDLPRVRYLQNDALALITHVASLADDQQHREQIREIEQLVDQSTAALIEYWARMDLFVLACHRNRVELDVILETPASLRLELLRRTWLGAMLGGILATVVIVPWIWTRDYWGEITGRTTA